MSGELDSVGTGQRSRKNSIKAEFDKEKGKWPSSFACIRVVNSRAIIDTCIPSRVIGSSSVSIRYHSLDEYMIHFDYYRWLFTCMRPDTSLRHSNSF